MDSILSVRINEEIKERFQKLAEEEGVNNKEFMDLIIKNYEVNRAATDVDFIKNDVEELQNIVKRIFDIYINMIDKNKIKSLEVKNNFSSTIGSEQIKNEKFKEGITSLEKDLDALKLENKKLNESLLEYKNLLNKEKEDMKSLKDLNVMLKDKIDSLINYKNSAEEMQQKNMELSENINVVIKEKEECINKLENELKDKTVLQNRINEMKIVHEERLQDIIKEFERKSVQKDNEMDLLLQKTLLQKEQEHRDEVWKLKSSYDDKISKLISDKENLLIKITDVNFRDDSK